MSKAFDEFMGCATNTAKDDAIWKFEEDCEREIGGNPVVGISGNYVSVSKDVTFEKAKAGVERFARKQAASVTRSRELSDAYEFVLSKRIVTDAAETGAQDAEVKSANGKVLKVGSRVCPSSWADKDESKAREVTRIDGEYVYLKGQSGGFLGEWLYSFDAAELAVGAKVQVVKGSLSGGNGVVKAVNGDVYRVAMSYGGEYGFRADQLKAYDATEGEDAADLRVKRIPLSGKWCVEPNISMFGGGAARLGAERKEFGTREEAEKYAKGTGKTYSVVDSATDAVEFVNDPRFRKAGEIVNQIYLLLDRGKKDEARKLFAANESLINEHSHAPSYVIKHLRDSVNATDADEKIHYELKGLVKTLRAKGLPQDEISRKLATYCRDHNIQLSYLNRSIFDGCEAAQDDEPYVAANKNEVKEELLKVARDTRSRATNMTTFGNLPASKMLEDIARKIEQLANSIR